MAKTSDGATKVMDSDSTSTDAIAAHPKVASSKVTGIYELLEQIIAYLPARDIILAKSVSRQFNEVIAPSLLMPPEFFAPLHTGPLTSTEEYFGRHEAFPPGINVKSTPNLLDTMTASDSWDISCCIRVRW